tara:strand:+ start:2172 stop:2429 length:258 start_codon:yes stop_codon:yes gene_type:complete
MLVNILVMVGCTSLNNKKESSNFLVTSMLPTYNLAGYLPAFKDGYIDGCETAKRSVHGTKNKKRFAKENQYRNGWKDGYNLCLGK